MKPKRYVIGLTGGIASGKSTALHYFQALGIPTLSADVLAHDCVLPGKPAYRAVLRHFGSDFRNADGTLNRKKLGTLVFQNKAARLALERFIHPCVIRHLKAFVRDHAGLMVLDIPLLFEAKLQQLVDEVVVVYATQAQQVARLRSRNGFSRAEALRRLRVQMPLREKCRRADAVVPNTGSLKALQKHIALYKKHLTPYEREL